MGKNTNMFSDLEFYLDSESSKNGGYGSTTTIKMCKTSYEDYIRDIQKQALDWNSRPKNVKRMNGSIVCRPKGLFDKRCFLTVDCDTEHMFKIALKTIEEDFGYEKIIIRSSPGHFWIICNVRLFNFELKSTLNHIPGCDNNYILFTERRELSILRATPRGHIIPEFEDFSHLIDSPFKKWLQSYYNFWHTEEMQWICGEMLINNL